MPTVAGLEAGRWWAGWRWSGCGWARRSAESAPALMALSTQHTTLQKRNHIITLHPPHYHTTPTPATLSHYTNHIITLHQHQPPQPQNTCPDNPVHTTKHNHTTPTPTTFATEHLPRRPCPHHRNTTTLHQHQPH